MSQQTRIIEIQIEGRSYFYPQYLGWFKKWKGFKDYYMGYYIEDRNFRSLCEAQEFLKKINHKPVINMVIHGLSSGKKS